MRVAVGFGIPYDRPERWKETVDFVVQAERLGIDSVWSAEAWGSDAVTPLGYLASRTERIKLGSGIVQTGTRTPALVAMTAATLQLLSEGRFLLGLGTSGPQVIEGWHGISFDQPVSRMREIVEIVRLALSGERVTYQGSIYQLPLPGGEGKALRLGLSAVTPVPIYLATLGPKSLLLTGAIADGWLGTSFIPEHADVFMTHLRRGAEEAGRSLSDLDLHAGGVVAFADDPEQLVEARRPGIAFTLGAMGSAKTNFYNDAFARAGYEELAKRVQSLWIAGRRDEATALIPDEIVLQTNLLGTDAMVAERILAYQKAGITTIRVAPSGATSTGRIATLERFMGLIDAL
ncbi:MAG TPA: LLM class F420-dependent oxidoreductase [Acidimicrobiia bacterium]|nr:LLM class F420-dependent oxidoreductase [Acidimicrobiia bacterium]